MHEQQKVQPQHQALEHKTTHNKTSKFTYNLVRTEMCIRDRYAPMVDAYVKGKANQNEFDALVSLAYNCGNVFVADGWAESVSYTHLLRSYFFIFRFEKNMM